MTPADPTNPLDYTCAECGAQAGEFCVTKSGEPAAATHKARTDLADARDIEQNPAPNPEQETTTT